MTYGPVADVWRHTRVDATTVDAPGSKTLTAAPLPSIVGSAEFGSTLSVRTGTWQPAPVALDHRWFRDGEYVRGGPTYVVDAYDAGHRITVSVRGSRDGYVSRTRTSGPTKVIVFHAITAGAPRITGNPVVGRTLTAEPGVWKPSSLELTYRWQRDGQAIPVALAKTCPLTEADRGRDVAVLVSAAIYPYDYQARASAGVKVR